VAFGVDANDRRLLASGGEDGTVRLWDPATGAPAGDPLRGHIDSVTSVAFGMDRHGRRLLASAGEDQTVRLWDPATGAPVGDPLRGHTEEVDAVAFGTDAGGLPLLASASDDGTVRLWDPATGTAIFTLLRRTAPRAIDAQNTRLAIADREGVTVIELADSPAAVLAPGLRSRSHPGGGLRAQLS
jgi:WD40 repeat protein